MTLDRHWYTLGRFQIFALPLYLNPYWTTHHIYLNGKLIGKQLSVPNEADCEYYVTIRKYVAPAAPPPLGIKRKPGRGRPRKGAYERWLEALPQ